MATGYTLVSWYPPKNGATEELGKRERGNGDCARPWVWKGLARHDPALTEAPYSGLCYRRAGPAIFLKCNLFELEKEVGLGENEDY